MNGPAGALAALAALSVGGLALVLVVGRVAQLVATHFEAVVAALQGGGL